MFRQAQQPTSKSQRRGGRLLIILLIYVSLFANKVFRDQRQYALQTLDALFAAPFLTAPDVMKRTGLARRTAFRILEDLMSSGVLSVKEEGAGRRPAEKCMSIF